MSDFDTVLRAYHLRDAIVDMTIRYGSSMQDAAYAEKRGDAKGHERARRAAMRRFRAIQRLSGRIPAAAQDGAR